MSDGVRIEVVDGVLCVTLDDPTTKNAITPTMVRTVVAALEDVAATDGARAVLLASSGDDFCAGANLTAANAGGERPRTGNLQRRTAMQAHRLIEVLTTIQLPVVAAVKGWAAGIGFQLALAADFTVAADDATFWEPFVPRGFTPDSGATWLLPRLVGVARAKELLLLGEQIDGVTAASLGIVHRAVPASEVDATAEALVARLADGPTVALGLTKACINSSLTLDLTEAMAKEAFALELSSRTADFKEGLAAFKERRAPHYEGR